MTGAYDLVIVGGGAGGLVAAREARQRGASALIVQDGPVGGDCTFTGCVPSKTLPAAPGAGRDFGDAMSRVHAAVTRVAASEDADALAAEGIDVIDGFARFETPDSIVVDGRRIRSKRFIVATVTGGLQFTHAAGHMGWVAASNALPTRTRARKQRFDPASVPWATFTSPEVGRVGLTEAEAAQRYPNARIAHLPLTHVDRAIAVGAELGFVTLIAAPRRGLGDLGGGRIVGATIVSPTGGDLIHEAAIAMQTNMFVGRLAQTTHASPTWALAVQQAALQFFGPSLGLEARGVLRQPSG